MCAISITVLHPFIIIQHHIRHNTVIYPILNHYNQSHHLLTEIFNVRGKYERSGHTEISIPNRTRFCARVHFFDGDEIRYLLLIIINYFLSFVFGYFAAWAICPCIAFWWICIKIAKQLLWVCQRATGKGNRQGNVVDWPRRNDCWIICMRPSLDPLKDEGRSI